MKQKLSIRRMRQHPDLEQLKRQSKELLAAFRAADAAAVNEVTACYDDPQLATFACTMLNSSSRAATGSIAGQN
jgi:hypothetical protein